jgi:hypothetical protein
MKGPGSCLPSRWPQAPASYFVEIALEEIGSSDAIALAGISVQSQAGER